MQLFLQIVGGFIVAILVLVVVAVLLLRWKLKSLGKQLIQTLGSSWTPPETLEVELTEVDDEDLADFLETLREVRLDSGKTVAEVVSSRTNQFESAGFEQCGNFRGEELGLFVRGFANSESGLYGAIYHIFGQQPLTDIFARSASPQSEHVEEFTVTDSEMALLMPRPPWSQMVLIASDGDVNAAVAQMAELTQGKSRLPSPPDEFAETYQTTYRDGQVWRFKHGLTIDDIMRVADFTDQDCDEETAKDLLEGQLAARAERVDAHLQEVYLETSNIPAHEWEDIEYQIVAIHELTTKRQLTETLRYEWADDDEDYDHEPELSASVQSLIDTEDPQTAFRLAQPHAPEGKAFTHHASVTGHFEGDLWLRPSDD